jgi:hypothetical protein
LCHTTTTLVPPFLVKNISTHGTACSMVNRMHYAPVHLMLWGYSQLPSAYAEKMSTHAKEPAHFFYRGGPCVSTHPQYACFRTVTMTRVDAQFTRMYTTFTEKKSQKWHTCREELRVPVPQYFSHGRRLSCYCALQRGYTDACSASGISFCNHLHCN